MMRGGAMSMPASGRRTNEAFGEKEAAEAALKAWKLVTSIDEAYEWGYASTVNFAGLIQFTK